MRYAYEQEIAIKAVTQASRLCKLVQVDLKQSGAIQKGDASPVTVADFGSQALICRALKQAFPNDLIVGEEDSATLRSAENAVHLAQVVRYVKKFHNDATASQICDWIDAGNGKVGSRYWVVDPIDGTRSFLRNGQYAIALALIEAGEIKVSTLVCPNLPLNFDDANGDPGVLFSAVRHQGAVISPLGKDERHPLRVSRETEGTQLRYTQSVTTRHGDLAGQEAIARQLGISEPPLQLDSLVKYGVVARGDVDFYLRLPHPAHLDYYEKIWDHAAGALLIEEAGGRVTDIHGKTLDFFSDHEMRHNQGILVSNGVIHQKILNMINQSSLAAKAMQRK